MKFHNPTYQIWYGMVYRCYNPKATVFRYYGGRGIQVCKRWRQGFYNFLKDMGYRPNGLSIDRIDSNGDYSPENCRWTDDVTQGRNMSHYRRYEAFGETKLLIEWSEDTRCRVPYRVLDTRIRKGWDLLKALTTPPRYLKNTAKKQDQHVLRSSRLFAACLEKERAHNIRQRLGYTNKEDKDYE